MPKAVISVDVETLVNNIKPYQLIKAQAVKDILKKNGFKIESYAKELVPVDTGRLRASISTNWSGSSMDRGKVSGSAKPDDGVGRPQGKPGLSVVVGTNVKYARRIEHGFMKTDKLGRKYNQHDQPYLHPAYFMFEGQAIKEISVALKKVK